MCSSKTSPSLSLSTTSSSPLASSSSSSSAGAPSTSSCEGEPQSLSNLEEDEIPSLLHTLACNDSFSSSSSSSSSLSSSFASSSRQTSSASQLDAFYSLWRSCRRSCSCMTMDLLRDQALRLVRIYRASSAAAKKVTCSSTRAPRDLLLSHVTYRVLQPEEDEENMREEGETATGGGGAHDEDDELSADGKGSSSSSPREVSSGGGAARGSGSMSRKKSPFSSEKTESYQRRQNKKDYETATIGGASDMSGTYGGGGTRDDLGGDTGAGLVRGGGDMNEDEGFFAPLATAAAVAEVAERLTDDMSSKREDGEAEGSHPEGGRRRKRNQKVLLRLKILQGFDVTCGGLRTPCLSSLTGVTASDVKSDRERASSEGVDAEMEEREKTKENWGNPFDQTQPVQGSPKTIETSETLRDNGGLLQRFQNEDRQDREADHLVERKAAVTLDFILDTEDWRISVYLWPLHAMMSLYEKAVLQQQEQERGRSHTLPPPSRHVMNDGLSSSPSSPKASLPLISRNNGASTSTANRPDLPSSISAPPSVGTSSSSSCGYLSPADAFALSILQSQSCWKSLKQWNAGQLQLEVWLQNAAASLGLLQLLTIGYTLVHRIPRHMSTGGSSQTDTSPTYSHGSLGARDSSPTSQRLGGDSLLKASFEKSEDEEGRRLITPDVVELLGEGLSIQLGDRGGDGGSPSKKQGQEATSLSLSAATGDGPIVSHPSEATLSEQALSQSSSLSSSSSSSSTSISLSILKFSYYGRACELSVDSTTGRMQLRCAWLPRRLRQLVLSSPEASARDFFILLPLIRRVAFFLSIAEETVLASAGEADLLPAHEAGAAHWIPPSAVVRQAVTGGILFPTMSDRTVRKERLHAHAASLLRSQEDHALGHGVSGSMESNQHDRDQHIVAGEDMKALDPTSSEVIGSIYEESSSSLQQPVGVIALEAKTALEQVLHLQRYIFEPIEKSEASLEAPHASVSRGGRESAEKNDIRIQGKDGIKGGGENGTSSSGLDGEEGGGSSGGSSLSTFLRSRKDKTYEVTTATCFFRVPPSSLEVKSRHVGLARSSSFFSSFIVALSLLDERIVACSYLLFPSASQGRGVPTTGAMMPAIQSLRSLLGDELFSPSEALGEVSAFSQTNSSEKLFATVRLVHQPFILTACNTPSRDTTSSRGVLPEVSVASYLRAVSSLLQSHGSILTQLKRVSYILPLLLPCTARGGEILGDRVMPVSCSTSPRDTKTGDERSDSLTKTTDWTGGLPSGVYTPGTASQGGSMPTLASESQMRTHGSCHHGDGYLNLSPFLLQVISSPSSFPSASTVGIQEEKKELPGSTGLHSDKSETLISQERLSASLGDRYEKHQRLLLHCTLDRDFMTGVNSRGVRLRDLFSVLEKVESQQRPTALLPQQSTSDRRQSHQNTIRETTPRAPLPHHSGSPKGLSSTSDQSSHLSIPLSTAASLSSSGFPPPAVVSSPVFPSSSSTCSFSLSISADEIALLLDNLEEVKLSLSRSEFERLSPPSSTVGSEGSLVLLKWLGLPSGRAGESCMSRAHVSNAFLGLPLIEAIGKVEKRSRGATSLPNAQSAAGKVTTGRSEPHGTPLASPHEKDLTEMDDGNDSISVSCSQLRAVCTLLVSPLIGESPVKRSFFFPSESASLASHGDPYLSVVADAVGRCLGAFLRIQVYIQLYQQLKELQMNVYGPHLRVLQSSFTSVEFLLQPSHSSSSSFIASDGNSDPIVPSSSSRFKAEKLRCCISLWSSPAAPLDSSESQQKAFSRPERSLPPTSHSTRGDASSSSSPRASPSVVSIRDSSNTDSEKTGVGTTSSRPKSTQKFEKSDGSLLRFTIEASTPQLTWLFRRQRQAALRLLPRHLNTLLQLLASSSELLACCIQLPLCLCLNVPTKRYTSLHQQVQQKQLQLAVSRGFARWSGGTSHRGGSQEDSSMTPHMGYRGDGSSALASTDGGEDSPQIKPFTSQKEQQRQEGEILGIWDLLKRPEEQLQALTEAAAGTGLELTQVYIQSMVPTRAESIAGGRVLSHATASDLLRFPSHHADSFGISSGRGAHYNKHGGMVESHLMGETIPTEGDEGEQELTRYDRECGVIASASLPALLVRVPGLPPVLLRLSPRCRCLLELHIVLQETRGQPQQQGGGEASMRQESESSTPQRGPYHSRHKTNLPSTSKTVTYVDVVTAVRLAGLADAWITAHTNGDVEKEKRLLQQVLQDITFEVSLLASFAGALRQFAAATCADLRHDAAELETAENSRQPQAGVSKRLGGSEDGVYVAGRDDRKEQLPLPTSTESGVNSGHGESDRMQSRESMYSPRSMGTAIRKTDRGVTYSPSFPGSLLLGYGKDSSTLVGGKENAPSSVPPISRLSALSSLFISPGSCLGIACSSPLLLGASHSLHATARVASLAFWPGMLLQQVLLPLLQLCKVFAAYSTAKVSVHKEARLLYRKPPVLSQSSSHPHHSSTTSSSGKPSHASSRRSQQPVEVESIFLSSTTAASRDLPSSSMASTRIPNPHEGKEAQTGEDSNSVSRDHNSSSDGSPQTTLIPEDGLKLWVSYTDFASRACACVVPSVEGGKEGGETSDISPQSLHEGMMITSLNTSHRSLLPLQPTGGIASGQPGGGARSEKDREGSPTSPCGRRKKALGIDFLRPDLYGLPLPLVTTGGVPSMLGEALEKGSKTAGKREDGYLNILRWSAAMSHALLAPWGSSSSSLYVGGGEGRGFPRGVGREEIGDFSSMKGEHATDSGDSKDQVPPILPRLHADDSGKLRLVIPFFQLRLTYICANSTAEAQANRSISVLKSFVCYVAPCLPLNNIPTFITHFLDCLSQRSKQRARLLPSPPSQPSVAPSLPPGANASASTTPGAPGAGPGQTSPTRDGLQETGAWLLQPLQSLAAHLAFHAALLSIRRGRLLLRRKLVKGQRSGIEKGGASGAIQEGGRTNSHPKEGWTSEDGRSPSLRQQAEQHQGDGRFSREMDDGNENDKKKENTTTDRGGVSLPSLPTDEECVVYRVVYASPPILQAPRDGKSSVPMVSLGSPGETGGGGGSHASAGRGRDDGQQMRVGGGQDRREDLNNARRSDSSSCSPMRGEVSYIDAANDDKERREDLLYRCYYPSIDMPLDIDPVFARFAAIVNQLHVGLSQYYQLYRHEYSRMYDHLSRTFAYLDSREWHLDPERDVELRRIILGEEKTTASNRTKNDSETRGRESQKGDLGQTEGGREVESGRYHAGLKNGGPGSGENGNGKEQGVIGGGKGLLEIPKGIPLLMPLPKVPFIECRFLPPHVPESLHMEFAVHRLLPLYHCPFYTCLHFIHLLPPSPLPPTCLVPWFPAPSTRPLLLLQPRAMPRRTSPSMSNNGGDPQGEESRKALTGSTTSPETGETAVALKTVAGGGGETGDSSISTGKGGSTPTGEVPWLPFLVYRCFTATLKVHPFPPPHVSLIEFQGIKLPAVLQELQRHERPVSSAVLKPQMERAARTFHLTMSYSLAACAALFFGAVDFDGLGRALQKLVAQSRAHDLRDPTAAGKLRRKDQPPGSQASSYASAVTPASLGPSVTAASMVARQQQMQKQQQLAQQLQQQQSTTGMPQRVPPPSGSKAKVEVRGASTIPSARPAVQHLAQKLMQADQREQHHEYVHSTRQQQQQLPAPSQEHGGHPQQMARAGVPPQQTIHPVATPRGAEVFQGHRQQPPQQQQVLIRQQQATTHPQAAGETSVGQQGTSQESRSPHLSSRPVPQPTCSVPQQQQNHPVPQQGPMTHQVQPGAMLQRGQHQYGQPTHVHPSGGATTTAQPGYPNVHQHGQIPLMSGQQPHVVQTSRAHHGQPAQQMIPQQQHAPTAQQHQQLISMPSPAQQIQQRPISSAEFQQNVVLPPRGSQGVVAASGVQPQAAVHQLPQPQRQQLHGHEQQVLLTGHHRQATQMEPQARQFEPSPFPDHMPAHGHHGHIGQQGIAQQSTVKQDARQPVFGTQQPPRQTTNQQTTQQHPMQHAAVPQQQLGYRQHPELGQPTHPHEQHTVASQQRQSIQQPQQHNLQYHQYQHDIQSHQQHGYSAVPVRAQGPGAPAEQRQAPLASVQAAPAHMWPGSGGGPPLQMHHHGGQVYPSQTIAPGQAAAHQPVAVHRPQHHPGHTQQMHVQQHPHQYMQQQGGHVVPPGYPVPEYSQQAKTPPSSVPGRQQAFHQQHPAAFPREEMPYGYISQPQRTGPQVQQMLAQPQHQEGSVDQAWPHQIGPPG
ncbi:mediator complex subunit med14 [Cystoisospora suis]|uniref:Mediator complex subunit med14 n=1 Tax=Cystoisospora suis TaxID=483139 RepID=A0A2C6L2N1_9APIC|nr:mediator complex subunit med14 [Cystoisospora suis]